MIPRKHHRRHVNLSLVGNTRDPVGRFLGFLQRREQHRDQKRDDPYDDQKFHQGKSDESLGLMTTASWEML